MAAGLPDRFEPPAFYFNKIAALLQSSVYYIAFFKSAIKKEEYQ